MQYNSDFIIVTNFEYKTFVYENVAVVRTNKMHVALKNGNVVMQNVVKLVVPDFYPRL